MKDNVILSAEKLRSELENSKLIKQYRSLKKQIENNEEIQSIAKALKASAKRSDNKQEFLDLKAQYENHPLIVDFQQVEAQVNELLTMLKDIIEN